MSYFNVLTRDIREDKVNTVSEERKREKWIDGVRVAGQGQGGNAAVCPHQTTSLALSPHHPPVFKKRSKINERNEGEA